MQLRPLLVGAALVSAVSLPALAAQPRNARPPSPFVKAVSARAFVVSGTVVSAREGSFVLRIDDHGHSLPFATAKGVARPKAGQRVTVRYHPDGDTGQTADEVRVH